MMKSNDLLDEIKKTKESLGELYPILVAADGEIVDGMHRATAGWKKKEKLPEIKTPLQKLVVRYVANNRRKIHFQEKRKIIDAIAEELIRKGMVKPDPAPYTPIRFRDRPKVIPLIADLLGMTENNVNYYISGKYKRGVGGRPSASSHGKRGVIETRGEFLEELSKWEGIRRTVLMYKTNLSWKPLNKILGIFYQHELIEYSAIPHLVYITPKGLKILAAFKYVEYFFKESKNKEKSKNKGEITSQSLEKTLKDLLSGDVLSEKH